MRGYLFTAKKRLICAPTAYLFEIEIACGQLLVPKQGAACQAIYLISNIEKKEAEAAAGGPAGA
jgi:hypothetical protein